jgi:hypothetical protein
MTNALIGTLPHHYDRLGLTNGVIQDWEDGLRTAATDGTFEWWYFDAHLDDGSTVTAEFHTKPPVRLAQRAADALRAVHPD